LRSIHRHEKPLPVRLGLRSASLCKIDIAFGCKPSRKDGLEQADTGLTPVPAAGTGRSERKQNHDGQ
jgi:hypothetical protein